MRPRGRDATIGPSFGNVDIAVLKGGPIEGMGEAGCRKYRFTRFDLFNSKHRRNQNTVITNAANIGRITHTADEPRILQLSPRLFP